MGSPIDRDSRALAFGWGTADGRNRLALSFTT
jgi:hypothetical protein